MKGVLIFAFAVFCVLFVILVGLKISLICTRCTTQGFRLRVPANRQRRRRAQAAGNPESGAKLGLEKEIRDSLPVTEIEKTECKEGFECAVCLTEFLQGEKASMLPSCKHMFHSSCIDVWFKFHTTCPLCRTKVSGSKLPSFSVAPKAPDPEPSAVESEPVSGPQNSQIPFEPVQVSPQLVIVVDSYGCCSLVNSSKFEESNCMDEGRSSRAAVSKLKRLLSSDRRSSFNLGQSGEISSV